MLQMDLFMLQHDLDELEHSILIEDGVALKLSNIFYDASLYKEFFSYTCLFFSPKNTNFHTRAYPFKGKNGHKIDFVWART